VSDGGAAVLEIAAMLYALPSPKSMTSSTAFSSSSCRVQTKIGNVEIQKRIARSQAAKLTSSQ